jgi:hypothetical protein
MSTSGTIDATLDIYGSFLFQFNPPSRSGFQEDIDKVKWSIGGILFEGGLPRKIQDTDKFPQTPTGWLFRYARASPSNRQNYQNYVSYV